MKTKLGLLNKLNISTHYFGNIGHIFNSKGNPFGGFSCINLFNFAVNDVCHRSNQINLFNNSSL